MRSRDEGGRRIVHDTLTPARMTDRRLFLADLSRYALLAAGAPTLWRLEWRPRHAEDPFTLGVASGDPTPDGAVLWTRLAPRPLEPEGGMDGRRTVVRWELAEDEAFTRIVQRGSATAAPELGYSVHVDLRGLPSGRWYCYRFTSGDAVSPVGRVRTAPAPDAEAPLRFAVASCQHWEQGLWTAYAHLAREELDLVTHLGDYIYEYATEPARVRAHVGLEIRTVEDYRRRYAQYKSDPLLQAAHARCPWIVTWDDHEVDNNYADLIGENVWESAEQMRQRRAAAYQAWWEHMPVRVPRAQSWADLTIHRSAGWGRTARLWTLDTRQYRGDQPCGDGNKPVTCDGWDDPSRSMLGAAQEQWLVSGLAASTARWQVLAQQVIFAPPDEVPPPDQSVSMDQWSGYPHARDRVAAAIATHAPGRTVVLTGDVHSNWVFDVRRGLDQRERPVVATEFVGTSISSGGDGSDAVSTGVQRLMERTPSLKWFNNRRGYYTCTVEGDVWRTDYRTVPFVSRPGAEAVTASSWRVERGRAGVQRV
jgi:alkaline phosphatase D